MAYEHVYFKNCLIWQLNLGGVVNMDVGYKASDPGSKHYSGFFLFHFILHSKVGLELFLV